MQYSRPIHTIVENNLITTNSGDRTFADNSGDRTFADNSGGRTFALKTTEKDACML